MLRFEWFVHRLIEPSKRGHLYCLHDLRKWSSSSYLYVVESCLYQLLSQEMANNFSRGAYVSVASWMHWSVVSCFEVSFWSDFVYFLALSWFIRNSCVKIIIFYLLIHSQLILRVPNIACTKLLKLFRLWITYVEVMTNDEI